MRVPAAPRVSLRRPELGASAPTQVTREPWARSAVNLAAGLGVEGETWPLFVPAEMRRPITLLF